MKDTNLSPLDMAKPTLTVRPGPGQRGWQEQPDKPKMVGGVYWAAGMDSIEPDDAASFVGSVK